MDVDLGIGFDNPLETAAVVVGLLICSAFFASSETGLTAASKALLHHLERAGNRRARIATRLRENQNRLLGGLMIGNNLVNILASSLTTSVLVHSFGDAGVAYATVGITVLVVVFGEVLPKTYAINYPERVALFAAPLVRWVLTVLGPLVTVVDFLATTMLRLVGSGRKRHQVSTAQELRSSFDLKVKEGGLVKHERDMMGSILALGDVAIADVMVHRKAMVTLDAGRPARALVAQVLAMQHTRLPLWRDTPDNIVGVLHAKDLLRALAAVDFDADRLDLDRIMVEPWFVPDTTRLADQLTAFRQRRAHFALVVDEYGTLMGLITLEDIIEEIVGEIDDEHDKPVLGVKDAGNGSYLVDGTVTIRDLNRQFDWDLPDEEATTVAGLVIHEARMIPQAGQSFVFHGMRFEILRRQRNQITQLRLTPPPPRRGDEDDETDSSS